MCCVWESLVKWSNHIHLWLKINHHHHHHHHQCTVLDYTAVNEDLEVSGQKQNSETRMQHRPLLQSAVCIKCYKKYHMNSWVKIGFLNHDLWPSWSEFSLGSKWTFVPNLRGAPYSFHVHEHGTEGRLPCSLASHHQNWITSSYWSSVAKLRGMFGRAVTCWSCTAWEIWMSKMQTARAS